MNIFKKRTPCKGIFSKQKAATPGQEFFGELKKLNPWAFMFYDDERNFVYINDCDVLSLRIPEGYRRVMEELLFTNGEYSIFMSLYG